MHNFIDEHNPEILLYVSLDGLHDSDSSWCDDHMFEVVEITDKQQEDLSELNEGSLTHLKEKTGFQRVYEALETHMWSNMNYETDLRPSDGMHSVKSNFSFDFGEEMDESEEEEEDYTELVTEHNSLIDMFKKLKTDSLDNQVDDFENTMAEFKRIRELAQTLPSDKRRVVAAEVALALSSLLGDESDEEAEE